MHGLPDQPPRDTYRKRSTTSLMSSGFDAPRIQLAAAGNPGVAVEIPASDPLFAYLQAAPGPVDVARLD